MLTQDAVIKRINRALSSRGKEYERVKKARGEKLRSEVGEIYRLDINRNLILEKHINVEQFARELGVLAESETIAEATT